MTALDERLREAHAGVPEPDAETVARVRERLEAAMAEPAPRRRRSRRRLVLAGTAAAALAVAAAVAIAVLPTRVDGPVLSTPSAQAAKLCSGAARADRCLRALGDVAAIQRAIDSGEVLYQRNAFTLATAYVDRRGRLGPRPDPRGYAISRSVTEDVWLAADGSGQVSYGRESQAVPAGPADGRAWRAAGSPDLDALMGPPGGWGPKVRRYGPRELERALIFNSNLEAVLPLRDPLSVLPRDPRRLEAFLMRAARRQRPGSSERDVRNTFGTDVTTFLRYPRTPPDLRAALLDVFAGLDGARLLGSIRDGAGRQAAAIDLPAGMNDGRDIVAFDPETARLVGEGTSVPGGGVRWGSTYAVEVASVPKVGQRP